MGLHNSAHPSHGQQRVGLLHFILAIFRITCILKQYSAHLLRKAAAFQSAADLLFEILKSHESQGSAGRGLVLCSNRYRAEHGIPHSRIFVKPLDLENKTVQNETKSTCPKKFSPDNQRFANERFGPLCRFQEPGRTSIPSCRITVRNIQLCAENTQ